MTDLVARLRLETDTGDSEAKMDGAARSVEDLGEAGKSTAGNLSEATRAADDLDKGLGKAGEAASGAGRQLRQGASDADAFARSAKAAGDAAGNDLGGKLDDLKDSGAKDALKDVGEAAGGMGDALEGAGGKAGGAGSAIGSLVGTMVGSAGLAVAMGAVSYAIDSYSRYEQEMVAGAELAITASADLAEELQALARDAAELSGDTDALTLATQASAEESLAAASAYDIQAAAARRAARDIREMTAAQLDQHIKELDRDIHEIGRQIRGGGVFDIVTTDSQERAANSERDLLASMGRTRISGFSSQSDADAIADLQRRRASLAPADLERLQKYERDKAVLANRVQTEAGLVTQRALAVEAFGPRPPPTVLQSEEIVIEGRRDRGSTRAGPAARQLTDEQRDAERFLKTAADLERAARLDTAALLAEAAAAGETTAAREALRVTQAGLAVQHRLGVESLDDLSAADRKVADAAIAAAEANERQAIATEKVIATAKVTGELDAQITATRGYAEALAGGEAALVAYGLAEAERQAIERAGTDLTPTQIEGIRGRVRELERLKAVTEGAEESKALKEDLRLVSMTADERERELRVIQLRNRYLRDGTALTEAEADARARIVASYEQESRRRAEDIGRLKTEMRDAYIESGELGFDQVGDYAEKRLRAAIYDALYAKPIDIIINATVNLVGDIAGQILGGLGGGLGGLAGGLGRNAAGGASGGGLLGALGGLLGGGGNAGGLAGLFGPGFSLSGAAGGLGSLFGLGGGAAAVGAHAALGSAAAVAGGHAAVGSAAAAGLGGAGGLMSLLGPIGIAAGLIAMVAPMFGNGPSNNGARATFSGDGFTVGGSKRTAQTTDAVTGAAGSVLGLIDSLKALGINAAGVIKSLDVGVRDPSKITLKDGSTIKTAKGDTEALVKAAATALLKDGVYDNPQMEKVVDQMLAANKSFDEIAAKLGEFVAAQSLGDDLKLQLLRFTDERGYALKTLENSQKARRDQIDGYAAEGFYTASQLADIRATLAALESAELSDALARLGEGAVAAAQALKEARPRLQDWLDGLGFTDAAQLNPAEERQLAMAQYERLLEKARAGDADALGQITGAGDRLLETDQAATSSAQARLALFNKVQSDIAGLVALSAPIVSAALDAIGGSSTAAGVSPVVAATQAGTAQLEALTAEVVGLRADLVASIERLGGDLGETYTGVGVGLAELLEHIRQDGGSALEALNEMVRDGRLNGALLAASASRITQ